MAGLAERILGLAEAPVARSAHASEEEGHAHPEILGGLAAVIGLTVGIALVASGQGNPEGGPPGNTGQNPQRQDAAVVIGSSTVGTVGHQRRRTSSAHQPGRGRFCLQPTTASGITPIKAIPNITMPERQHLRWTSSSPGGPSARLPGQNFEFVAYDLSTGSEETSEVAVTVGWAARPVEPDPP